MIPSEQFQIPGMVTSAARQLSLAKHHISSASGRATRLTRGLRSPQHYPSWSNSRSAPSDQRVQVNLLKGGIMSRAVQDNSASAANEPDVDDNKVAHGTKDSHQGHAFLHDFCMAIPYGIAVALAGTVALCLKQVSLGFALICSAAAIEYIAALSIKRWKQRGTSASLTAATAAIAAAVTAMLWRQTPQRTWAALTLRGASVVSALLLLFFVYNIAAGGNPPKEDMSAADASTAAS